ncbi:alcohol dehydrogenase catalytic domain-containing protein [Streptomyces griseofuscus]
MRKVSFAEFGGPDVLRLTDAEEPHAGPGRIRIAVRAAGVNPVDWRIREGQKLGAHPTELPSGVGLDAAGVVDEVGEASKESRSVTMCSVKAPVPTPSSPCCRPGPVCPRA